MAIAFAQNLGDLNTASGTSLSGTFGSSTVSGNLILGAARIGAQGRTQTFTDSKSNTWATNPIELDHGVGNHLVVGYAKNISGGASHAVTCSISGAAASIRMCLWEEAGLDTTGPLDKTSTNTSAVEATVDSLATATTAQADEWLLCVGSWDGSGTVTGDAAFGHLIGAPTGASKKMAAEDRIVSATGTYNGTFTVSAGFGQWGAAILTFKAATGGTTFNDSGTGTMTLSGSGVQSQTHTGAGAGTMTLSGAGVQSATFNDSGTGTLSLSGTGVQSQTHTRTAAGTITLTGSAVESNSGVAPPSAPPPSADLAFQLSQPGGAGGF